MPSHMSEERISETLEQAGFSEGQVEALMQIFALHPHNHTIDQIIGLQEELEQIAEEEDDDETDDEE